MDEHWMYDNGEFVQNPSWEELIKENAELRLQISQYQIREGKIADKINSMVALVNESQQSNRAP
jgi:hypothetical protein